jgi:hypothetical protein
MVRQAVNELKNAELSHEFMQIERNLQEGKYINKESLATVLCSPIESRPTSTRELDYQNQLGFKSRDGYQMRNQAYGQKRNFVPFARRRGLTDPDVE